MGVEHVDHLLPHADQVTQGVLEAIAQAAQRIQHVRRGRLTELIEPVHHQRDPRLLGPKLEKQLAHSALGQKGIAGTTVFQVEVAHRPLQVGVEAIAHLVERAKDHAIERVQRVGRQVVQVNRDREHRSGIGRQVGLERFGTVTQEAQQVRFPGPGQPDHGAALTGQDPAGQSLHLPGAVGERVRLPRATSGHIVRLPKKKSF